MRPQAAHGTRARYVSRTMPCRCELCRAANAAYIKSYREGDRDTYLAKRRAYRANKRQAKGQAHVTVQ